LEKLGINLGYLIAQIAMFVLVLVLLKSWMYAPMLKLLAERRERIAKSLEDARVAEEARANAERDAQQRLAEAQLEAQRIVADAGGRADQAAAAIREQAEKDARHVVEQGRVEAEVERNRALADLRSQVIALSLAAAQRVIGTSLDENRQRQLVNDFFAKVPADVRVAGAASAEVTTALPLSDDEKARAVRELGVQKADFKVDPRILGGVIVRVGDRVVDASAAGQLESLRSSLR
jgi:F-type H+-transporting ATPase subunit b